VVVEVIKDEELGKTIHVLNREVPLGPIKARIDPERRFRHMQHHTAQHLLTQCFIRLFDLETVSAHINGYAPSHLDISALDLSKDQLDQTEDLANQIIYENHQVKTYFVEGNQIKNLPLRRPPKVTGIIRIVEIDSYDYSACGGTHCQRTGEIGVVKIVKCEHQNQKTRVHFVAGSQALAYFRTYFDILTDLAGEMSTHPQDLIEAVQRQADQLKSTQRELDALRQDILISEARELAANGETTGPHCLILATFEDRPVTELRLIASQLQQMQGVIALLATYDGRKISLVVSSNQDSGISARELVNQQLAVIGGKGGGDATLAQGGGQATREQFERFFDNTRSLL
jgi:alanyl-tRNA synthetase